MEYEYEHDEEYGGRVLWGRVGVYVGSLLLAFILGSCLGGRGGPDQTEVDFLEVEVETLRADNERLEDQIRALTAGQAARDQEEAPDDGEAPDEVAPDEAAFQTYTVQRGDTLYIIARQFYGEGTMWEIIADANGIDSSNRLTVGQELRIPPAPDG